MLRVISFLMLLIISQVSSAETIAANATSNSLTGWQWGFNNAIFSSDNSTACNSYIAAWAAVMGYSSSSYLFTATVSSVTFTAAQAA